MERRLPIAGGRSPAGEEDLPADRPPCPVRAVAVLPAREGIAASGFRDAVIAAAREAGLRAGDDPDGRGLDLVVGGPELARRFRPWVTVVISAGLPRAAWTGVARALRAEVDVVLADPREAVARALVA